MFKSYYRLYNKYEGTRLDDTSYKKYVNYKHKYILSTHYEKENYINTGFGVESSNSHADWNWDICNLLPWYKFIKEKQSRVDQKEIRMVKL